MEKREKVIKIRTTESEYQALREKSKKPKLAEWMREHCLDARTPRANKVPEVSPALLRQLAGMGNNLNQIARAIHSQAWDPIDRIHIVSALQCIEQELALLRIQSAANDR